MTMANPDVEVDGTHAMGFGVARLLRSCPESYWVDYARCVSCGDAVPLECLGQGMMRQQLLFGGLNHDA